MNLLFFSFLEVIIYFVPLMKENRYERFVVISSSGVLKPIDGLILSNTIRSTLDAWINSISKDLIEYNITFNTIIPGKIKTEREPSKVC
jgi:3-oxoacyl-[acyl-carrier protein] reductase